jgi:hypothetical protein
MIAQSGPKRISYEQRRNVEATGQGSDGEGKKRKEKERKSWKSRQVEKDKDIPSQGIGRRREGEKEPWALIEAPSETACASEQCFAASCRTKK